MLDDRITYHIPRNAHRGRTVTPIGFLECEEESLIEQTDLLEQTRGSEESRTKDEVGFDQRLFQTFKIGGTCKPVGTTSLDRPLTAKILEISRL